MTFLTEARKVANPAAPMGYRFRAFCHCMERFSPLGFQATQNYLAEVVGAGDRWTAHQLMEALDLLMQERQRFLDFDAMWEVRRRALKKAGQRTIGSDERAERESMPWLSWPRERIRNRRIVVPSAPPEDAFPFRPVGVQVIHRVVGVAFR